MIPSLGVLSQSSFNSRQTRQYSGTHNPNAFCRHFIHSVICLVPVRVTIELNEIYRVNSGAQKRFVIVPAYSLGAIYEIGSITQVPTGLPDDVLQPFCAHRIATQFQILVSHHVEKDQGTCTRQFFFCAKLRNVMPAAVCIVRSVWFAAIVPTFAERLFTIKKDQLVSQFSFFSRAAQHASDLEQCCH